MKVRDQSIDCTKAVRRSDEDAGVTGLRPKHSVLFDRGLERAHARGSNRPDLAAVLPRTVENIGCARRNRV